LYSIQKYGNIEIRYGAIAAQSKNFMSNPEELLEEFMRPAKYKSEFIEDLFDHCNAGYSFETFSSKLSRQERTLVTPDHIAEWRRTYPEFDQAVRVAFIDELYFWQTKLLEPKTDKNFVNVIQKNIENIRKQMYNEERKEVFVSSGTSKKAKITIAGDSDTDSLTKKYADLTKLYSTREHLRAISSDEG
jgi:hypothetical protein